MSVFWIQIIPKFIPDGKIYNKSALVQMMALRTKPITEPMMTQFTDPYRSICIYNALCAENTRFVEKRNDMKACLDSKYLSTYLVGIIKFTLSL